MLNNAPDRAVRDGTVEENGVCEGKMIVATAVANGRKSLVGSRRVPWRVRSGDCLTAKVAVAASGSSPQPCRPTAAASGAGTRLGAGAAGPPDDDEAA
jgi:hypothetical protein